MSNRAGLPRLLVATATALALVSLSAATSFSYAEEPQPPDQVAVQVTESTGAETATDQTVTDEVTPAPAEVPVEVPTPAEPAAAEVSVNETTTNEATDPVFTEQVVEAPAPAPVAPEPAAVEVAVEETTDPGTADQAQPAPATPVITMLPEVVPCGWPTVNDVGHRLVMGIDQPGTIVVLDLSNGIHAEYPVSSDGTLNVRLPHEGTVTVSVPVIGYVSEPLVMPALSTCELPEIPVDPPPAPVKAYAEIEACAYNGMGEMVNFVVVHSSANDIAATFTYSNGVVAQKVLAQGRNAYDTLYGGSVRVDVPEAGYSVELALELVTSCSGYVPPKIEVVPTACIEASDGSFWASLEVTGPVGKGLEIQVGDSDRQAVTIGEEGLAFLALQPEVETPFYVWNGDIKVYEGSFKGVASCSPIPEEPPIVDPPAPPVVNPPVVNPPAEQPAQPVSPPAEQPVQQPAQPPAEQPAEQPTASNDGGRGVPFETGTSNNLMIAGSMLVAMVLLGYAWGLAPRRREVL